MSHELIEIEKGASYQAVLTYLQNYTQKVRNIQEKYALENKEIISPKLLDNPRLSSEEMATLSELKRNLNNITNEVAERVEKHRVVSYDVQTKKYFLKAYDRIRVDTLVRSVGDINKSIQKIKFIVEVYTRINKQLISEFNDKINSGEFPKTKMFVLGNILLIYEFANYLINFFEGFKLDGIEDVEELYDKEINRISNAMEDLQKLKDEANSIEIKIDDKVKQQVISNLNDREQSLKLFKEEWGKYIKEINRVQEKVYFLKDKIPTLKIIRDNAQNQLDFFEIMKIFGIMMVAETVRKNLAPLSQTIDLPLNEINLIPLPPQTVYDIIGLQEQVNSQAV